MLLAWFGKHRHNTLNLYAPLSFNFVYLHQMLDNEVLYDDYPVKQLHAACAEPK